MSDNEKTMIKITVKGMEATYTMTLEEDASIAQLRDKMAEQINAPRNLICLIFSGSILKDNETLKDKGILDGITVHWVLRTATTTSPSSAAPAAAPVQQQTETSAHQETPANQQRDVSAMIDYFRRIYQGSEFNVGETPPMSIQELMNIPLLRQFMGNPEMMRSVIMSDPGVRNMVERNPELGALLNDPVVYRETLEMIQNPAAFQEMVRNQDRIVSNIENLPGGMAALERMFQEMHEPMMDAAQNQFGGGNPFVVLGQDNQQQTQVPVSGAPEDRIPMPNPWAPRNQRAANLRPPASSVAGGVHGSTTRVAQPARELSNAALVEAFFSNGQLLDMLSRLARDTSTRETLANAVDHDFSGQDADLQRQIVAALNNAPDMKDLATAAGGSAVFAGIWQVLRGIHLIVREAPNVFKDMPVQGSDSMAGSRALITDLLRRFGDLNPDRAELAATGGEEVPRQLYASGLRQLESMGFSNEEANLRALILSNGDVNGAVDLLLRRDNLT